MLRASAALLAAAAILAGAARASDDEVRVSGTCTGRSAATLRVREDDGRLRLELEVRSARRGALWRIVVLHERRLVGRAALRAPSGGGALRLRRSVRDLFGTDAIVVRASRTRESCRVQAVV